jgi:hypothetical protein
LNTQTSGCVKSRITPCPDGEISYKSKYWPGLNGMADEAALPPVTWGPTPESQNERENTLLDVIGAYDLLLMQGLTPIGALTRLGLHKSRDELVWELDCETAHRLAIPFATPTELPRNFAG